MRRSKSNLTVIEIDQNHEKFRLIIDTIANELGNLSTRQKSAFAEVKGFTLVLTSPAILAYRSARQLIKVAETLEQHMFEQYCSYQKEQSPKLVNFLSEDLQGISAFEQAHLFEHLISRYLKQIRLEKGPIESRTFRSPDSSPAILISNQFHPVEFRDLCQYVWHLLGRAIRRGTYPTVAQLEASLYLRRLTFRDNAAAFKILLKAGIQPPS